MKKKILILGASSFIGSNLIYENKNLDMTGLIRKPINKYSKLKKKRLNLIKKKLIYINSKNIYKIKKYDVIINSIGLTKNFNNKKYSLEKNKKKFHKYSEFIFNVVKHSKCKIFIHLGSSMEYSGLKPNSRNKLNENSITNPNTKYGKFKIYEKKYFEKQFYKSDIKLVFLRLFSIYGFFLKNKSLIHSLVYKKKISIQNPYNYIDVISIEYLLKIIKKTIEIINNFKKKIIIINCSSNNSIKIKTLLEKIQKIKKYRFIFEEQKNGSLQYIGCSNITLKLLKLKKFDILDNVSNLIKNKKIF